MEALTRIHLGTSTISLLSPASHTDASQKQETCALGLA